MRYLVLETGYELDEAIWPWDKEGTRRIIDGKVCVLVRPKGGRPFWRALPTRQKQIHAEYLKMRRFSKDSLDAIRKGIANKRAYRTEGCKRSYASRSTYVIEGVTYRFKDANVYLCEESVVFVGAADGEHKDPFPKTVISVEKRNGYELRTERVSGGIFGCKDFEIVSAYSPDGTYIGSPENAKHLVDKMGIAPEKARSDHKVCSIGFCANENKWYGWSHRAIYGFGVGSHVKPGDCAYKPRNFSEFVETVKRWYADDMYSNLKLEVDEGVKVKVVYDIIPKGEDASKAYHHTEEIYPERWIGYGRGEWTAKTLEDAKQMAIDFAEGVS